MSDLIIAEVLHGLRLNSWHEAADLIEQQQQRIAELVDALDHIARVAKSSRTQSRRDRWVCLRANCAISSSDEWRTADLPKIIENSRGRELRLRAENKELAATVERLREAVNNDWVELEDLGYDKFATESFKVLSKVPQQNLNAVKREAIIEAINAHKNKVLIFDFHTAIRVTDLIKHANSKYPSIKDGE